MPRRPIRAVVTACLALALAAPAVARAGEGEGGKKQKPSYQELSTLSATVNRPGGRRGVLTVEVGVDAPDPALRDRVELSQPLLRDAYVSALQPYALGLAPGSPPSADYIAMTLQRETDRVLGRRGARVLLGTVLVN